MGEHGKRETAVWMVMVTLLSASSLGSEGSATDGAVVKRVIRVEESGENLLKPDGWQPWQAGFAREGSVLACDNGTDAAAQRGASQTVTLNQRVAEPIVATVSSRAEGVTGSPDNDYALYLDLSYVDGTHLWGQAAPFDTGTHDWQSRRVVVVPDKPVRHVSVHLLLRRHGGKAWFRDPRLSCMATPDGAARFDGVPIVSTRSAAEGFQVRDVAAEGDYVAFSRNAVGLVMQHQRQVQSGATFFDVTIRDTTGRDRAISLLYCIPVDPAGATWLIDPRRGARVTERQEYTHASRFRDVGTNGGLSLYPFGAVVAGEEAQALGIDMAFPAFYRIGYNAATAELFLVYDIGLTAEKPEARVRFCRFTSDGELGFRGALARYYELYPGSFQTRAREHGLWMPFAKISGVRQWQDFGFKFKEGDDETAWDDQHGIITFRYTEPLTWWMRMPESLPRTLDAARDHARQLAERDGDARAKALLTSGYHDAQGRFVARLLDTPWCDGAVWSMNSMPGIPGNPTDFQLKWNAELRSRLYGPARKADLDGEYVDSSEGYVTDELDYCRAHFAGADTPLCFSSTTHQPAIFRGLIAFEYVRRIAHDVHAMNKLMMANSTPIRLCWLAPSLDVLGTETDWNPNGKWQPMSDADLLYRRALCGGKPYCFLMNTQFEQFPSALVEKYMKRATAYGMFPGFFSHNASEGHYFTRPDLYDRDRPLFKKYVPLCRLLSEAGWQPLTRAVSSDEHVHVERFGDNYLTLLNDSARQRSVTVTLHCDSPGPFRELVTDRALAPNGKTLTLSLGAEDLAVLKLR
ncbi:MAG: hypothetical protein FJ276_07585 [Planctomycetes bacterium]|nr:hypothetical protein [Planctomycetota bacterium]